MLRALLRSIAFGCAGPRGVSHAAAEIRLRELGHIEGKTGGTSR